MRKIIAGFACSVDGYIEGPNKEYDWILIDKEIDFSEQMKRFDSFLFGRNTYEAARAFGAPPTPGITNYVFSRSLESVDKNFNLVKGNTERVLTNMKQQEGKDIALFGGANLLASVLDLQLVDELEISFIPVLLGKGKPIVDVLKQKLWLELIHHRSYSNGTIKVNYKVRYQ